jgi:hypothetical protein
MLVVMLLDILSVKRLQLQALKFCFSFWLWLWMFSVHQILRRLVFGLVFSLGCGCAGYF